MALGTDDFQSACCSRVIIQLDIGTTACHVRGDGNRAVLTGQGYDLSLALMELGVQDFMLDPLFAEQSA